MDTRRKALIHTKNDSPANLSMINERNAHKIKHKRNKVNLVDDTFTSTKVLSEIKDLEKSSENNINDIDDNNSDIDLYNHIIKYRLKTGGSMFPTGDTTKPVNCDDSNARLTASEIPGDESHHIDEQLMASIEAEYREQGVVDKALSNSTPSTPSCINLSPCESEVESDIESSKAETYTKLPCYLESRDHGFPQVRDDVETQILQDELQSLGIERRWADNKTLAECNMFMLEHKLHTDVAMMVGDNQEVVHAHSFILTSRSPEFADLLSDQMHKSHKFLMLPGVRKDAIQQIIRYIYTDKAELNTELALALMPTTLVTGPRALRGECLRYLLCNVTADIACTILEYAHAENNVEVHEACLRYIHVNAEEVIKMENFFNLCTTCLDRIISSDSPADF